ncbi:HAMP domain-containing protein [Trichothermofontia sp.]
MAPELTQEIAKKLPKIFQINLTTKLLGAVFLIMGTTVMVVHIPWLITARRNIDDIVSYVNNQVTQGTGAEVERIFNNVALVHHFIEQSFLSQISLDNPYKRELFYLKILEANPGFSWLQFGFPNGDFFGANRVSDSLSVVNRRWNDLEQIALKTSDFYTIDAQGNLKIGRTEIVREDFYSPQRSWYKAALETPGEIAWSDVYIFRTSRTPGVSSGLVLKDPDSGDLLGVVSIAFELKQVSTYLQDYDKHGQFIFLSNLKQEIIASSSSEEAMYTTGENDELMLKKLADATDPNLRIANQVIKAEALSFNNLSTQQSFRYRNPETKENFFVSFSPLGYHQWMIGTVIPEALYLKDIQRNLQTLIIMLISMILIISSLVFLLAKYWLAKPILQITKTAAAIEQGDFKAIALAAVMERTDELGHLARVFNRMAQEIYGREKELKQQVTQLQVEIDEAKRAKEVKDIVESDFFKDLQKKARTMRQRRSSSPNA